MGQAAPGRQDDSPHPHPFWKSWGLSACNSWPWANKRLKLFTGLAWNFILRNQNWWDPTFPQLAVSSLVPSSLTSPQGFQNCPSPKKEQDLKPRLSRH